MLTWVFFVKWDFYKYVSLQCRVCGTAKSDVTWPMRYWFRIKLVDLTFTWQIFIKNCTYCMNFKKTQLLRIMECITHVILVKKKQEKSGWSWCMQLQNLDIGFLFSVHMSLSVTNLSLLIYWHYWPQTYIMYINLDSALDHIICVLSDQRKKSILSQSDLVLLPDLFDWCCQ